MRILNETRYVTKDLKRFFSSGLKSMGAKSNKVIRVVYTKPGAWRREHDRASYATGCAYLGRVAVVGRSELGLPKRRIIEARHATIRLPPPGVALDYTVLARVFEHEVLHLRGVGHRDMTQDQLHCRGPLPAWAEGLVIELEAEPAPMSAEERAARRSERFEKRAAHAQGKLDEYEYKMERIQTHLKKWRQKVRYYERAMAAKKAKSDGS